MNSSHCKVKSFHFRCLLQLLLLQLNNLLKHIFLEKIPLEKKGFPFRKKKKFFDSFLKCRLNEATFLQKSFVHGHSDRRQV